MSARVRAFVRQYADFARQPDVSAGILPRSLQGSGRGGAAREQVGRAVRRGGVRGAAADFHAVCAAIRGVHAALASRRRRPACQDDTKLAGVSRRHQAGRRRVDIRQGGCEPHSCGAHSASSASSGGCMRGNGSRARAWRAWAWRECARSGSGAHAGARPARAPPPPAAAGTDKVHGKPRGLQYIILHYIILYFIIFYVRTYVRMGSPARARTV
jgi:hypothetical protein